MSHSFKIKHKYDLEAPLWESKGEPMGDETPLLNSYNEYLSDIDGYGYFDLQLVGFEAAQNETKSEESDEKKAITTYFMRSDSVRDVTSYIESRDFFAPSSKSNMDQLTTLLKSPFAPLLTQYSENGGMSDDIKIHKMLCSQPIISKEHTDFAPDGDLPQLIPVSRDTEADSKNIQFLTTDGKKPVLTLKKLSDTQFEAETTHNIKMQLSVKDPTKDRYQERIRLPKTEITLEFHTLIKYFKDARSGNFNKICKISVKATSDNEHALKIAEIRLKHAHCFYKRSEYETKCERLTTAEINAAIKATNPFKIPLPEQDNYFTGMAKTYPKAHLFRERVIKFKLKMAIQKYCNGNFGFTRGRTYRKQLTAFQQKYLQPGNTYLELKDLKEMLLTGYLIFNPHKECIASHNIKIVLLSELKTTFGFEDTGEFEKLSNGYFNFRQKFIEGKFKDIKLGSLQRNMKLIYDTINKHIKDNKALYQAASPTELFNLAKTAINPLGIDKNLKTSAAMQIESACNTHISTFEDFISETTRAPKPSTALAVGTHLSHPPGDSPSTGAGAGAGAGSGSSGSSTSLDSDSSGTPPAPTPAGGTPPPP